MALVVMEDLDQDEKGLEKFQKVGHEKGVKDEDGGVSFAEVLDF